MTDRHEIRWLDWTPEMVPEGLTRALFEGALVRFRGLPEVAALVERARKLVSTIFGSDAHEALMAEATPAESKSAVREARRLVGQDPALGLAWRAVLSAIGFDCSEVRFDRVRLRVVPSRDELHSRSGMPLGVHRDTWGSGIQAQINWWLPLFPLARERTMLLWPDAFMTSVRNNSGEWDHAELVRRTSAGTAGDYPHLPVAEGAPPGRPMPVMLEPGELMAFSAAHLHGSASDDSGLSRFSLDTRTVWEQDVCAGRGAPNVDGAGAEPHWEWFLPHDRFMPPAEDPQTRLLKDGGVR